ncbi:MAG: DEAD/DEAH box helicase [Thermoplasmatota archaeon]
MDVIHPALKPGVVEFRGYQANLARSAAKANALVVLPTGLGKTVVALLVIADALQAGARRILVLAPTRPLVEQHRATLQALLGPPWDGAVTALTGHTRPQARSAAYENGIVVATPQVAQNDILEGRLDPARLDWIVYDEAHRAVGEYPYVFIAAQARKAKVRALGLTASPGHEPAAIDEVRQALGLDQVEIRTPADPDVAPYVQAVDIQWEGLALPPELGRLSARLQEAVTERVRVLRSMGFLKERPRPGRRDLLELAKAIQGALHATPNPDPALFSALSLQAQTLKLQHALELAQTQGAAAFIGYVESLREEAATGHTTKASQSVLADARVNEAYHIARLDVGANPKVERVGTLVGDLVAKSPGARAIVFTHYRNTCQQVVDALAAREGVRPVLFVGQQSRRQSEGLSQKEQAEALVRFRSGEHNVLVATSVAEEGLDIPDTDLVIFFEPIPSEIRAIQRRGRTGRKRAGRVVVLMYKGTQDEAAHWVSRRREREMVRGLQELRSGLPKVPGQSRLDAPESGALAAAPPSSGTGAPPMANGSARAASSPGAAPASNGPARDSPTPIAYVPPPAAAPALGAGPAITCDHREKPGGVARHLHALGAHLEFRQLEVGDFVLSDRVVAERKECADFVASLLDGRLFEQLKALQSYPRPLLILEGESLAGHRNVSPEALMGALASVVIDYGVPVLQSRDPLETARLLVAVAKREQQREGRRVVVRPGRPAMSDAERALYVLCGLPGVSDVLAERLWRHFGSVGAVLAAPEELLAAVAGVGQARAALIRRVLDLPALAPAFGLSESV